jgi:MFS family permease
MSTTPKKITSQAVLVLLLAVSFYLYEYLVQVAPAVMTAPLMRDFALHAGSISATLAFFYYAYSPMQLPGGLLYDRFGPRKILTLFMAICVLGVYIFAHAHSTAMLALGRFLMGAGGAVSFVGPLILAARWFAAKHFAFIAGMIQTLGAVGAILGQVVVAKIVEKLGWRMAMMDAFVLGIILVVLIALLVRNHPKDSKVYEFNPAEHHEVANLKELLSKTQTYIIALYSFFTWLPMTVFGALWGVSFLAKMYDLNTLAAAEKMAFVWGGVAVGSPFFAWWSEKINKRCLPLSSTGLIGLVAMLFVLFVPMNTALLALCLFGIGLGTSGQSLSFAVVRDVSNHRTMGTAMGFNNLAVVAGGAIGQPLVGFLMDLHWSGAHARGVPIYSLSDYQSALVVIPISFLLVFIFGQFLIKETHCKSPSA